MKLIGIYGKVAVLIFSQLICSCIYNTITCEENLDSIKNDRTYIVLLKLKSDWGVYRTYFEGINPQSRKKIKFGSHSQYYTIIHDYIEIGDTLKKDVGITNVFLLKKDSIIVFTFPCVDGYSETKILSFHRPLSKGDSLAIEKLNQKE